MSCILTAAIAANCRDGVGGVSGLWAVELGAVTGGTSTETAGALTALALEGSKVMFKWNFAKDSAAFMSDLNTSLENGTTFYKQTLECSFWKWETAKRNELKIAATTPICFVVKDNNEQYWLLGMTRGMEMQSGSQATSGKLLGDKNGYTLTFVGDEPDDVIEVTDSTFISALP